MSERLEQFLIGLASDPDQMRRFNANPAEVLEGARLSGVEREAVLARDSASVRRVMGGSRADLTKIPHPKKKGPHKGKGKGKGASKKSGGKSASKK
jgi:hypothetical protein